MGTVERTAAVMLLAGGVGSRLNILGQSRAKPAIPFGGHYRIIDFTLSNIMNSGLTGVGILTQYKPYSLMAHIGTGRAWDFIGHGREARILPPHTGERESDWYKGTADAVWQNWPYIEAHPARLVLIVSGDHIYHMDYSRIIQFHLARGAAVTIAAMVIDPSECRHFGMIHTDEQGRITRFEEKPDVTESRLASMGVYVFDRQVLHALLEAVVKPRLGFDFGKDIVPRALEDHALYAFPFEGYWRDVGTIQSYFDANVDLLTPSSGLDIDRWRVYTNPEDRGYQDRPPAHIHRTAKIETSLISCGARVRGTVVESLLSPGVVVEEGAEVRHSIVLHDTTIGRGSTVDRCIIDKDVTVMDGAMVGDGDDTTQDPLHPTHVDTGITLVGKGALVPPGTRIGRNCVIRPRARETDYPMPDIPSGETIGQE